MKRYSGQAPLSEFWSEKRRAEFKSRGFGTFNMGSRLSVENPVSSEIDQIVSERLIHDESRDS